MTIEIDENTGITTTICFVVLVIGVVFLGSCRYTEQTNQEAIKAGLVQKGAKQTGEATRWDKP